MGIERSIMKKKPIINKKIESMIRVNHAGEYGAVRIYKGQRAALCGKDRARAGHMLIQEEQHLEQFHHMLVKHRVQPTIFQPLWHVAAYALGYITAKIDPLLAHACTEAVETVIVDHYQHQLNELVIDGQEDEDVKELYALIHRCQQDEQGHLDDAIEYGAHNAPQYPFAHQAIKKITRLAIGLSKRR